MSDKPIGEIVGRQDSQSAAPETGATQETVTASETATGQAPGNESQAAAPEDPVAGLKSALDKERDRASRFEKDFKKSERTRQQEAAALRREIEALRAAAPKPDPDDAFYSEGPGKTLSSLRDELRHEQARERAELSKELARDKYEDFEDVEAVFLEAAAKNPSLWEGVETARLPALVVYKRGKQLLAGAESAPESRIAKLEAEIAELRAGRDGGQTVAAAETAAAPVQKPSIPRSNVGARSSGVGKTNSWAGPTPINKIFGRQRDAR